MGSEAGCVAAMTAGERGSACQEPVSPPVSLYISWRTPRVRYWDRFCLLYPPFLSAALLYTHHLHRLIQPN